MKNTLLFLTYLLLAAVQSLTPGAAWGEWQEKNRMGGAPEGHGMMEEKFLERLGENLGLSEAQKSKIKAVVEQSKPEMQKLHEEMKALRRKTHEAIRETLTLEQKEKFDMMSMKMRMGPGGGFHGRPGALRGVKPEKGSWVKNQRAPAAENAENESVDAAIEPSKAEREPESVEPDSD